MIQNSAPKRDSNQVQGNLDLARVARGHWSRPTGSGRHADKRTKRQRTRGSKLRASLAD